MRVALVVLLVLSAQSWSLTASFGQARSAESSLDDLSLRQLAQDAGRDRETSFRFIVFGDSHPRSLAQPPVEFTQALQEANL